ncbi:MAG: transposase [Janthinobacterium lividum]
MRQSKHTESEILHLLAEVGAGESAEAICRAAQISNRTFYRWRKRYGALTLPAAQEFRELQWENRRLRSLVTTLSARLAELGPDLATADIGGAADPDLHDRALNKTAQRSGESLGRFAAVRGSR